MLLHIISTLSACSHLLHVSYATSLDSFALVTAHSRPLSRHFIFSLFTFRLFTLTDTSPVCPSCQQTAESVEHALVECHEAYAFWFRLNQILKFPQYSQPNTRSISSLYIVRNQQGQSNVEACSLTLACGL
jgi:hypothetical protein